MDIHTIPAGRELDAIVAEKVMGWVGREGELWTDGATGKVTKWGTDNCITLNDATTSFYFRPSTDIAAAFEVAEKIGLFKNCRHLHEDGVVVQEGLGFRRTGWEWVVEEVLQPIGENTILARGETAPLAICRAALWVKEEMDSQEI